MSVTDSMESTYVRLEEKLLSSLRLAVVSNVFVSISVNINILGRIINIISAADIIISVA